MLKITAHQETLFVDVVTIKTGSIVVVDILVVVVSFLSNPLILPTNATASTPMFIRLTPSDVRRSKTAALSLSLTLMLAASPGAKSTNRHVMRQHGVVAPAFVTPELASLAQLRSMTPEVTTGGLGWGKKGEEG